MKIFTYSQYIKCIHTFRLNAVMQLAEESIEYKLNETEKKYLQNQLIKDILQNKKEATKFINEFLEPREVVKETDLIRYTSHYLTKKYKTKEADLIYKLKSQDIFFLIEHRSSIEPNMSYKMLNYCLDIIREWNKNKKAGRNTSYPIVVPILIYTGNQKWKMPKKSKEKPMNHYVLERYKMEMEYNFIDINKLPKQMLLEKHTMFSNAMFLKKAQNKEELTESIDIIMKSTRSKENLEELTNIINILNGTLEDSMQ